MVFDYDGKPAVKLDVRNYPVYQSLIRNNPQLLGKTTKTAAEAGNPKLLVLGLSHGGPGETLVPCRHASWQSPGDHVPAGH